MQQDELVMHNIPRCRDTREDRDTPRCQVQRGTVQGGQGLPWQATAAELPLWRSSIGV